MLILHNLQRILPLVDLIVHHTKRTHKIWQVKAVLLSRVTKLFKTVEVQPRFEFGGINVIEQVRSSIFSLKLTSQLK